MHRPRRQVRTTSRGLPALAPTTATFLIVLGFAAAASADGLDPIVEEDRVVTRFDSVPRFCNPPDVTATSSGLWSDDSIWSTDNAPTAGARVLVPSGVSVTYDLLSDLEIACIEVGDGAELRWATAASTRLRVSDLQVLPGGALTIGEASAPMAADALAEIVFVDSALDTGGVDPAQYGTGLHVFGRLTVVGAERRPTYGRITADLAAGATEVGLEGAATGWRPGDRLIVPDTRQIPWQKHYVYASQAEEPAIGSIVGAAITLSSPLVYDHYGPRDANGVVGPIERAMLPHVGNLTRNVVLRSTDLGETGKDRFCLGEENLTATDECVTRGHVMVHARAEVDVRYAAFVNLGRTTVDELDNTSFDSNGDPVSIGTNQIGRYSFHAHHLAGPENPTNTGFQYGLLGNVFEGFLKWGVAIHDTHYGLVRGNVLYDGMGSAIATEDGNESFNVFERNFVVHTKAGDSEQIVESTGRGGVENQRALFGFTRDGFWFSGTNNFVRDNVVANAPDFAYNYNGYYLPLEQPIPDFRGADLETDSTLMEGLPVLEAARNEAYGATGQALWMTWSRGCCSVEPYAEVSLFEDWRIWHVNNAGVESYHDARNTFDRFVLRNDPAVSADSGGGSLRFNRGFHFANQSYENGQMVFRNLDVQGFNIGLQLPAKPEEETEEPNRTIVEDSYFHNYVNLQENLPRLSERQTILRNVRHDLLDHEPINGLPDQPTTIEMRYDVDKNTNFIDRSGRLLVIDHNGESGHDFEVYFIEQGPEYPIPPPPEIDHPNYMVCPEMGLTNQECRDAHGIAVGGRIAPCVELDGDPTCTVAAERASDLGILGLIFDRP